MMQRRSAGFHAAAVLLLIGLAAAVRLLLFSGFVLGDDPAYADFVSRMIQGNYPPIGTHSVFACRPVLLGAIALPIYLFGWFDWSYVLPVLLASLFNTGLIYLAGARLAGPAAGVLGAAAYAFFPLDAVHATTMTNDILLSALVWGGAFLLLASCLDFERKRGVLLSALSGFVVGAAVAVKINAVVAAGIVLAGMALALRGRLRRGGWKTLLAWVGGWALANVLLCAFLYALSGDPLAHLHAEMRFNLDYNPSGYVAGPGSLARALLYYPKLIIGANMEGHAGYRFMPYGQVVLCFFLFLPLAAFRRFGAMRLPAALALLYMIIMEFAPLQLRPDYVPIHRLPRFLLIAAVPMTVSIGIVFSVLLSLRRRWARAGAALLFVALSGSSLYWAGVKASFYRDCALDQRWAWQALQSAEARTVVTDIEMRNYLMFRSGFRPPFRVLFPQRMPAVPPLGTHVLRGGARRPDMHPGFARNWTGRRRTEGWTLIGEAPHELKPWRPTRLQLCRVDRDARPEPGVPTAAHQTVMNGMKKIAELDVGSPVSEKKMAYQLVRPSWEGDREFSYSDETVCRDSGRGHRERETLVLQHLVPGRPLLILKRLDPAVAGQVVEVFVNGESAGQWPLCRGGAPGRWHESLFRVPAAQIKAARAEISFTFVQSAFDINGFYYWFYQPE